MTILSSYRFVVVPSRVWGYAVLDRVTKRLIADELTRTEARRIVKERNASRAAHSQKAPS